MSAQPLEIRMARLEDAYEQLDRRLGDLAATTAAGFAQVDARFAQVDSRFDQLGSRFIHSESRLDGKIDRFQWRMTSLIVATWIATIATILIKH
jgi:hypothetical protein